MPPLSKLMPFYRASPNERVQLECFDAGTNMIVSWSRNGKDLSENVSSINVQGADTRGVYCCHLWSSGRTSDVLTSYCTYILPQREPHTCVHTYKCSLLPTVRTYIRTYCFVCTYTSVHVHTYLYTLILSGNDMHLYTTAHITCTQSRLDRNYLFQNACTKPTVPTQTFSKLTPPLCV